MLSQRLKGSWQHTNFTSILKTILVAASAAATSVKGFSFLKEKNDIHFSSFTSSYLPLWQKPPLSLLSKKCWEERGFEGEESCFCFSVLLSRKGKEEKIDLLNGRRQEERQIEERKPYCAHVCVLFVFRKHTALLCCHMFQGQTQNQTKVQMNEYICLKSRPLDAMLTSSYYCKHW